MNRLRNTDLRPWLKPALVALIPVVLVGALLFHVTSGVLKARALATARGQAELVSRGVFEPRVGVRDLERGLRPARHRELRRAFGQMADGNQVAGATLWTRTQRPLASVGRVSSPGESN